MGLELGGPCGGERYLTGGSQQRGQVELRTPKHHMHLSQGEARVGSGKVG